MVSQQGSRAFLVKTALTGFLPRCEFFYGAPLTQREVATRQARQDRLGHGVIPLSAQKYGTIHRKMAELGLDGNDSQQAQTDRNRYGVLGPGNEALSDGGPERRCLF